MRSNVAWFATPLGRTALALCCLGAVALATEGKFQDSDAIPPGASAKVLPLSGKVVDLRGVSAGVSGKSESLNAALKDLGARTTDTEVRIELSSDVLFDFDKADLKAEALPSLKKLATVMQSYPNSSATIEGHTDGLGNEGYNQKLSERRAESVQRWLASNGVTTRMSTRGWGKTHPAVPNTNPDGSDNPENRQRNRRVEIVVKK